MTIKRTCGSAILALLSFAAVSAAGASLDYHAIAAAAPGPLAPIGPTTPEEMEAFMDGFMAAQLHGMAAQLRGGPVAGAVVVVVKDGAVFFTKGYGYEDVEKQVAIDPAETLFRPGSISKLFTWTAVMQLVEQGKLDLDADVNSYLKDVQVPKTFPEPVTLRNLMTHTPGFEDGGIGYLFAASEKDLLPLDKWLAAHVPARVRPPTTDFASGAN